MSATSSALGLADLALTWDETRGDADLSIIADDLASDAGLETAVILSLYTDRRTENDDVPPSGDPADRRGWWGDEFLDVEGDKYGSRLWLLDRAKAVNETALRAKEYIVEALQWLIDDKVASSVGVATQIDGPATGRAYRRLVMTVTIQRPSNASPLTFRFARVWDAP